MAQNLLRDSLTENLGLPLLAQRVHFKWSKICVGFMVSTHVNINTGAGGFFFLVCCGCFFFPKKFQKENIYRTNLNGISLFFIKGNSECILYGAKYNINIKEINKYYFKAFNMQVQRNLTLTQSMVDKCRGCQSGGSLLCIRPRHYVSLGMNSKRYIIICSIKNSCW